MSHRSPAVIRVASIGAALALAVAGCASSATPAPASGGSNPAAPSSSPQVGASGLTSQYQGPPVTLRLGYFPNITHATALVGVEKGIFSQALGPQRDPPDLDVQRRPGGLRGPLRRRHRRHLHRPQPGHQRLRRSPTARPSGSSRGPPRAGPCSWSSRRSTGRPTSRARSSPRPSSATPRTSPCARG